MGCRRGVRAAIELLFFGRSRVCVFGCGLTRLRRDSIASCEGAVGLILLMAPLGAFLCL